MADPAKADVLLFDADVMGFGARIGRGGARSYFVEYRLPGGARRRLTIGRHGAPWTVETARKEAVRILGLATQGQDMMLLRHEDRRGMTVAELCDVYLRDAGTTKKASTRATDLGRIERHIKPLIGRQKVKAFTRFDADRFMRDIAAGKTKMDVKTRARGRARVRGGRGTATRTLGLLGGIFTYAIELLRGTPGSWRSSSSSRWSIARSCMSRAAQRQAHALALDAVAQHVERRTHRGLVFAHAVVGLGRAHGQAEAMQPCSA
jgi:hypothetical protein